MFCGKFITYDDDWRQWWPGCGDVITARDGHQQFMSNTHWCRFLISLRYVMPCGPWTWPLYVRRRRRRLVYVFFCACSLLTHICSHISSVHIHFGGHPPFSHFYGNNFRWSVSSFHFAFWPYLRISFCCTVTNLPPCGQHSTWSGCMGPRSG